MKKTIVVIMALLMVFTIGGCKQAVNNSPKVEEQSTQTQDFRKLQLVIYILGIQRMRL